jgi:soluble lytic murein transglycosylase-like protein
MLLRAVFLSAAGSLAFSGQTHAQQVELLQFERAGVDPAFSARRVPLVFTTNEAALRANIVQMGVTGPNPRRAPAADARDLRLSLIPSAMNLRTPSPLRATECPPLPYRPRGDLSLAVERRRSRLYPVIVRSACEARVPVGLLDALVTQESGYDVAAVSSKGAKGLTQLMPATARYLAVANPFDPFASARGGAIYLREQLTRFGRVDLALAAYNAGPARVRRQMAVPAIPETRAYVSRVIQGWAVGVTRTARVFNWSEQPNAGGAQTGTEALGRPDDALNLHHHRFSAYSKGE